MSVFKHQPFDLDRPSIRILRLLKGPRMDDILCDLFQGWLDQCEGGMPYDALSYTWGSVEKLATVTVNGSMMHVTKNLYEALQHLRYTDRDRLLWIDAICINQDNKQERRHQVQQMSRIYKEAERVIIWLGQSSQEINLLMDYMSLPYGKFFESSININREYRMDTCSLERKGMELILGRPWFRRIWIIQEIANARVAIILCGNRSISTRTFTQFPSLLGLQPEPHCQAVLDIMPGSSRNESWWSRKRDLYTLLVKFQESKASDERDIIYALLGISSDADRSDFLLPDYEKSLQQVIWDTVSFILPYMNLYDPRYRSLMWTLKELLQSLDCLRSAVLWKISDRYTKEAIVKQLLDEGAKVESRDINYQTPLSWAANNGHEAVVKQLLDKGAELETKDNDFRTPLSWAAGNGHEAVVKQLLDKGAELGPRDEDGRTPLSWAAGNGHEAVVKQLLELGVSFKTWDKNGQTPLLWAAKNGNEAVVKQLLDEGAELGTRDEDDRTPLSWAAGNGHEAVVKQLLDKGARLETRDKDYRTPLSWAAGNGHEAVVKQLLELGVSFKTWDKNGQTPLLWAAKNGHEAVVKLLNPII